MLLSRDELLPGMYSTLQGYSEYELTLLAKNSNGRVFIEKHELHAEGFRRVRHHGKCNLGGIIYHHVSDSLGVNFTSNFGLIAGGPIYQHTSDIRDSSVVSLSTMEPMETQQKEIISFNNIVRQNQRDIHLGRCSHSIYNYALFELKWILND